jgi:hypothetical protein
VALGHTPGSEGQSDGHNGREPFRDRSHRQTYCRKKHAMDWLSRRDPSNKDNDAHAKRASGKAPSESCEAHLKRCEHAPMALHELSHSADLGIHSRRCDDAHSAPMTYRGALERHAKAVRE